MTVLGEIPAADFGPALVHEHVLVDFAGADRVSKDRYDSEDVVRQILPHLERLRRLGMNGFVECTPAYLGRDAGLLKRLASASGLQVLTNTGLYAAGQKEGRLEPYLPEFVSGLSAEELAEGWLDEWRDGIEGTGVRPGFIKIGVNPGPLRPASQKIVRAAALTSRQAGLLICCHAARAVAALECLDILEGAGVDPGRYVFVHAQQEEDLPLHEECARRGAWVEYDGVGPESADQHLKLIRFMLGRGMESRLLISQDAGWYRPGEPHGGSIRPYDYLWTEFLPRLRRAGLPQATIDHLVMHNPRSAFTLSREAGLDRLNSKRHN